MDFWPCWLVSSLVPEQHLHEEKYVVIRCLLPHSGPLFDSNNREAAPVYKLFRRQRRQNIKKPPKIIGRGAGLLWLRCWPARAMMGARAYIIVSRVSRENEKTENWKSGNRPFSHFRQLLIDMAASWFGCGYPLSLQYYYYRTCSIQDDGRQSVGINQ